MTSIKSKDFLLYPEDLLEYSLAPTVTISEHEGLHKFFVHPWVLLSDSSSLLALCVASFEHYGTYRSNFELIGPNRVEQAKKGTIKVPP